MRSVIYLIFLVFLPLFASSSWSMIVTSQRDSYSYDVNPVVENSQNYLYDVAQNLWGDVGNRLSYPKRPWVGIFLPLLMVSLLQREEPTAM